MDAPVASPPFAHPVESDVLAMDRQCPRCKGPNLREAKFCSRCGFVLDPTGAASHNPARTGHPSPLPPPDGFTGCDQAADLHCRWESAWGGATLAGTESLALVLFNGGYALREVTLGVRGENGAGQEVLSSEQPVERLPRGEEVEIEIPSYALSGPAEKLTVSLVSAEFDPEA